MKFLTVIALLAASLFTCQTATAHDYIPYYAPRVVYVPQVTVFPTGTYFGVRHYRPFRYRLNYGFYSVPQVVTYPYGVYTYPYVHPSNNWMKK